MGFFEKMRQGLTRTRENIGHSFAELSAGERGVTRVLAINLNDVEKELNIK